jgi:hypothetical protein
MYDIHLVEVGGRKGGALSDFKQILRAIVISLPGCENPGTVHGRNNYEEPNPKCRLYWCLIEFVDWRYTHSCWYFQPLRQINTYRQVPLQATF